MRITNKIWVNFTFVTIVVVLIITLESCSSERGRISLLGLNLESLNKIPFSECESDGFLLCGPQRVSMLSNRDTLISWQQYATIDEILRFSIPSSWEKVEKVDAEFLFKTNSSGEKTFFALTINEKSEDLASVEEYVNEIALMTSNKSERELKISSITELKNEYRSLFSLELNESDSLIYNVVITESDDEILDFTMKSKYSDKAYARVIFNLVMGSMRINNNHVIGYESQIESVSVGYSPND